MIAVGKHSQDDALAHRRAAIGGMATRRLRLQVAEAFALIERTEAGDIARATRREQQATDIAWPPDEVDQAAGSAIRVNRCNEPGHVPAMHRITDHTSTKGEEE